jgi:hypothetical protein
MVLRLLVGAALVIGVCGGLQMIVAAEAQTSDDKKQDKKEPDTKAGTVVGMVTAKTENSIDVKADGEEKARRYVPQWVGGAPAQGGGYDKAMLKAIREAKVGSRVRLEWKFEERPRAVKLEILKPPAGKDK